MKRLPIAAALVALALLTALALWQTGGGGAALRVFEKRPEGVMGTDCRLVAVAPARQAERARQALDAAEAVLRREEARFSRWIDASELSRLNATPPGQGRAISPPLRELLEISRRATRDTRGAFDPTIRPLLDAWKQAGQRGSLPTPEELERARRSSGWRHFDIRPEGAGRTTDTASLDLGGIAKGYAIDRALRVLAGAGLPGGLVDVGGDLACFGTPPAGEAWQIDILHPLQPGDTLGAIAIPAGAVCTSGYYARYTEIEGRRYSHILDPRTGRPAQRVPSVTVLGPEALHADLWATALSVLGEPGLALLPPGYQALLVQGGYEHPRHVVTPGLAERLDPALRERVQPFSVNPPPSDALQENEQFEAGSRH